MKRFLVSIAAIAAMLVSANNLLAFDINIDVAPNVLSLDSQGQVVTLHTDIAYSAVAGATVQLNGLPIAWWKSDNQGNFVAKFNLDAVKELLKSEAGNNVTVELTGETKDGDGFSGTDTIKVIKPKK
jgi:hypothetical protein